MREGGVKNKVGKRLPYETPMCRDLTAAIAGGQSRPKPEPEGWCVSGNNPTQPGGNCNFGLRPTSSSCNAGLIHFNACSVGSAPTP